MKLLIIAPMSSNSTSCPLSVALKEVSEGLLINGYSNNKIQNFLNRICDKLKIPYLLNLRNIYFIWEILRYKPNFIFISNGRFINPLIILLCKLLGKKVIIFLGDNMNMKHYQFYGYKYLIKICNLIYTVDCPSYKLNFKYKKIKYINKSSRFKPEYDPKPNYNFDVIFVGSFEKKRASYIKYLLENNINVSIFGTNWEKFRRDNRKIYNKDIIELNEKKYSNFIKKSKISLCFLRKLNHDCQSSRPFELAALSACIVSEETKKLKSIFKESQDVYYFKNKEDLLKIVRRLLLNKSLIEKTRFNAYSKVLSKKLTSHDMAIKIMDDIKNI